MASPSIVPASKKDEGSTRVPARKVSHTPVSPPPRAAPGAPKRSSEAQTHRPARMPSTSTSAAEPPRCAKAIASGARNAPSRKQAPKPKPTSAGSNTNLAVQTLAINTSRPEVNRPRWQATTHDDSQSFLWATTCCVSLPLAFMKVMRASLASLTMLLASATALLENIGPASLERSTARAETNATHSVENKSSVVRVELLEVAASAPAEIAIAGPYAAMKIPEPVPKIVAQARCIPNLTNSSAGMTLWAINTRRLLKPIHVLTASLINIIVLSWFESPSLIGLAWSSKSK
mmetsp:Transcript_145136/g.253276  ORF Transcript_145136/g.253276 Transcript_145136/m.253276 type:complete len:290 (+) Transcript_145136:352-1221(+)